MHDVNFLKADIGNTCFATVQDHTNYILVHEVFCESAKQGNVEFQYKLTCFLSGHSELNHINYDKVIDYAEAVKWFRRAALQGDRQAQYHLAGCYWTGRGVCMNIPLAVKWFCVAGIRAYL